jgi:hypothetical protein
MCVCIYILYIYLELGLVDNRSCVEPLIGPGGPLHTDRWTWTGPHPRTLTEVHDHQMPSDRTDTGPCSHTPSHNRHMPRYRTTSPQGPITLKPYDDSIQRSHRFYWRWSKAPSLHPLHRHPPFSDAMTASRPPSHTDSCTVAYVLSQ